MNDTDTDPTEAGMAARRSRIPIAPVANDTLQTRVEQVANSLTNIRAAMTIEDQRLAQLERQAEPPPPPVPMPVPPADGIPLTAYLPLALSILLILSDQAAVVLHTLRPSEPVTVALVIVTILSASIPEIRSVIGQQQAHAMAVERERTAAMATISTGRLM